MRVVRLSRWHTPDGVVPVGAVVDMSDELARVHIAQGLAMLEPAASPEQVPEPAPAEKPPAPRRR